MLNSNPTGKPAAADLLASILSSFGTPPPKEKRKAAPRKANPPALPLPKAFSLKKTGYVSWAATHRVLQVQEQECTCCGSKVEYIKAEYFALENGTAHASWLRTEGYGIDHPADLPITYVDLEPMYVPGCASCRTSPFDDLESLFFPRQMELPL